MRSPCSTSGDAWPYASTSCLNLLAALLLIGFSGCAGPNQGMQLEPDDSIQWADALSSREPIEDSQSNTFELTQLEDSIFDDSNPTFDALDDSVSLNLDPAPVVEERSAWATLMDDQREFYLGQNVRPAILTLGSAAILANTNMDQEFTDWYQSDVRSDSLDEVADVGKMFGEQWPMVGLYVGASVTGRWLDVDPRFANWGDRSLRSMFVGVPPLLFLQKALGASRPNDSPPSSDWDFWADDNGASGHAFVGAVPFLVASQLAEHPRAKATWLALSTLTGWSRINDNDHYLSQVIVGWWLAYAATRSVARSEEQDYEIAPVLIGDSPGLEATWRR